MAKLSDYIKHPEKISEEEWQDYHKMIEGIMEMKQSFANYNIDIKTNNTSDNISKMFYQEHFIMAGILEAFYSGDEISFKQLNESLLNYFPKEFLWNTTVVYINSIIARMIQLGFINPIKTDDKYSPKFKITDLGINALQQQTFQNLASSSFFNYQTHILNKRSVRMNILMLIVTIVSVLVTIITILK